MIKWVAAKKHENTEKEDQNISKMLFYECYAFFLTIWKNKIQIVKETKGGFIREPTIFL